MEETKGFKPKRAKATGKNKLAKQIGAFFSTQQKDDEDDTNEEEHDDGQHGGAGALPDPADRAAFNEYTNMITARECIAVVARRAELYQAAVHLEARPSVSLALVNVAGSRERSAARSVPTNVCGLGGTVARAFANLLTRLSL